MVNRNLPHYAGQIIRDKCIAICGFKEEIYAGVDLDGNHCFCGSSVGDECGSVNETQCLEVYASDGLSAEFTTTPPTSVKLLEDVALSIQISNNLPTYSVYINGKILETTTSDVTVKFTQLGNNTLATELGAYWGARSPLHFVTAYAGSELIIQCPEAFEQGVEFECLILVTSGSDLTTMTVSQDGSPVATISDVSDPLYYQIGSDLRSDRFHDYMPSYNWTLGYPSAYININHQFTSEGVVKAFEAYISRLDSGVGCVRFLILKPTCDISTQKYCHSKQSCVDLAHECGDAKDDKVTFYSSSTDTMFCSDTLRFTNPENSSCLLSPPSGPAAQYEIVYEHEAQTSKLGNNVFGVSDVVMVKPGYILGWVPCMNNPGDIGYYPVEPVYDDLYPVYVYDEVYKLKVGAVFSMDYPLTSTLNVAHMLRASVFSMIYYSQMFTGATANTDLDVSAALESTFDTTFTASKTVRIQEAIVGLTVAAQVDSNKVITLTLGLSTGLTDVTFCIHWDMEKYNGTCDLTTTSINPSTVYPRPGVYTIFVKAYNLISMSNVTTIVTVKGSVSLLEFIPSPIPIKAVATNEPLLIELFGSGLGPVMLSMEIDSLSVEYNVSVSSHFYAFVDAVFSAPKDVLSVIKLSDNKAVAAYGSVEDPIASLSLEAYGIAETNVSFQYRIVPHIGTNVTYRWKWSDGHIDETNGTYNVRVMNHTFHYYGNLSIHIEAWNKISFADRNYTFTIQDKIEGLFFVKENLNTEFGSITTVDFYLTQGTAVNLWIDFDLKDNFDLPITTPKAVNMDMSGTAIYGRGGIRYPKHGQYNLTIHCENSVSTLVIWKDVYIQEYITNLTVHIEQQHSGGLLDYVEVNETLTIIANISTGSIVTFVYNFGDGSPPLITNETSVSISYSEWRVNPPYKVEVSVFNEISRDNLSIPVFVQKPVQNMTGFGVTATSANSTYPLSMTLDIISGDDFSCGWNFEDGSPLHSVDYPSFLESNVVKHIFPPGEFDVVTNCSNRLYNVTLITTVYSYHPITDFVVDVFSKCDSSEVLTKGGGKYENSFDVDCEVVFFTSDQKGTNVTYIYDFNYVQKNGKKPITSTSENSTSHKFKFLEDDTTILAANVLVLAKNPIQEFLKVIPLLIIRGIQNVTVKTDDTINRIGMLTNFTGSVSQKAHQACYAIDFGDAVEKGADYKPLLFGHSDCQSKEEYMFHSYLDVDLLPDVFTAITSYMYKSVKTYMVAVTGTNDVSSVSTTIEVKILDLPCEAPVVAWDSAMADEPGKAQTLSSFFKCRKYNILSKAVRDCQKKTAVIQREWSLQLITYINETGDIIVNKSIEIPGNDTRYIISERQLDYGLYHIQLKFSMFDLERNIVLEGTDIELSGYFEIKRCDLIVNILGGYGRAVGQGGVININASQSTDPDMEPNTPMGLHFDWFCKQDNSKDDNIENEYFKENLDDDATFNYPESPDPAAGNSSISKAHFKGCFGQGHGRLIGEGHVGSVLFLNTTFMLYSQKYNVWLRLSQTGRKENVIVKYNLRVVYGVPPEVSIECKLNCLVKKNPTQKLSFLANCLNCKEVTPYYEWSMVSKEATAPEEVAYEDDTELLKKSVLTNIQKDKNLVIKPNSLSAKKIYILKLSVYWTKADAGSESGGFSEYAFEINTPPYMGKYAQCLFNEMNGKALDTKFQIRCFDIHDVDTPLTYSWFYLPGNSTKDWTACTFPRQGRPESALFSLPAGNSKRQNLVKVKVIVTDLYGASMNPYELEIRVDPKPIDSASVDKLLDQAMDDPAVMGSVMNGLLENMKSTPKEQTAVIDQSAVKDKMVAMLAQVKIDSPAGAQMVAGTLDNAADASEAMSEDGVEKSLTASANIANFADELTAAELAEITQKTLSATSKFTANVKGEKAAEALKNAMASESALTSGAAANMVAGESASSIKTSNGETKVSCIDPKDKSNDLGGFELPDMDDDDNEGGCTGASNSMGKNRFAFDESSKGVMGPTLGLELSAGLGKKKKVQNLTKPIRLVIPNIDPLPVPESHTAYCELMRVVHLVKCDVNTSSLFLKMKPKDDNFTGNLFAFMNKGIAPSLVGHQHNCTLPNPYPDGWENMTTAAQQHFEEEVKWRCVISAKAMEDYCEGRWCVGIIYYTNSTNTTTKLRPRDYPIEDAKCSRLNYTFYAYTRSCLYWSHEQKKWSSEGCKVSMESKDNETVCYCDHLTDFGGGGPFAEPQPIDFGAAFSGFSNLGENPTVFAVVLSLIVLYFMMLVWARRKDKKNLEKAALAELPDNHRGDTYYYEIAVQTGFKTGSTTTSEVFIKLFGVQSDTQPRKLNNPNRKCFNKGETDTFLLAVPYSLGNIKEIEIWHNNTGASPGWFLMQVQITNLQTYQKFQYVCNKWLDVAEDDGLIHRRLEKADKEDLTEFSFAFAQMARKNLYDGHIWFSVFTRPAASTFSTVQRLSTCFSLLLTTMLANAMFYTGDDAPPSDAIRIGPFTISITQIRVGFTSSLIVIPANLLIITLFKKAGPKRDKNAEKYKKEEEEEEEEAGSSVPVAASNIDLEEEGKVKKHNKRVNFLKSILFAGREDDDDEKMKKKKNPLPHWLIYIAYFFVFVTSAVSSFFVILYGFTFGKEKSDKWVVSMLISFFQSVLIIQPVKVLVLSVIFALIVKDPTKDEDENKQTKRQKKEETDEDAEDSLGEDDDILKTLNTFKLPDERRLEESRQQRLMEKRIKAIIREIVVHLMFVVLCLMVAYAASDPYSFQLSNSVRKQCQDNGVLQSYFQSVSYADEYGEKRKVVKAAQVSNRLQWFDWIRYSVTEYLFPNGWYNGDKSYEPGFTADTEASKVLAMARIRQLRVKSMSCTKHPVFVDLVVECNAGYSMGVEETNNYHYGWTPPINRSSRLQLRRGKRKAMYLGLETPWSYQSATELKSFPFFGKFATYSGSSYSVNIGPKKKFAKAIVKAMKDNFWVDRYTRALFVESNIYNANTNLLLIVTMLHEILPTGGWNFFTNIQSLRLYRYVGGLGSIIMLFDLAFTIVTLVGLYKAIKHGKRQGFMAYLSNPWNFLHVVVTLCSLSAIVCTGARMLAVKWATAEYKEEPELFASFAYVGQLEFFIMAFIGFVVFFTNLEFLRILRFNRRIGLLTKTMSIVGKPLRSFALLFMIIFMAYVSLAHCMFVDKLPTYSTVGKTFVSLTKMFLGKFKVYEFLDNAPVIGPILFFSYMLAIQMVLINMFVGIVCDSFASVREEEDNTQEADVLSYMANRVKKIAGSTTGPDVPIYSEWKTDWEVMMEKLEERCDNCVYALGNFESEDSRQTKWFDPKKADEKKKNMLVAVLGLEYFLYDKELCDGIQVLERKLRRMTVTESKVFLAAAVLKRKDDLLQEQGRASEMSNQSRMDGDSSSDNDSDNDDGKSSSDSEVDSS